MNSPIRNRSRLMLGCGSAALALALALAPQDARAQGIDASGNVVFGSAEITNLSSTETLVDVFDPTVVIDWTPNEDAAGNALDFIRTGALARFEGASLPNFAVLNRILPSTNGNVAVIDGSVISRVLDPNTGGLVPGGFVAFYSPTGILIGNNAVFDVGSLMLTTLNVSNASFQNFAQDSGNMTLQGAQGSTARIQINPGAQISALAENSFFAVVAADVQMLGTARINGSHAYIAGEVVNLSFSNGLFNISVPVGTAASGTVMELNGNIGGPASTGVPGDNHMIYAVATAQTDPISMIFRGNLGFDPAQSAGVVNGEIILSANHNVFGRTVDGGNISDGINAVFGANSATSNVRADITVDSIAATSSLLAISTHRTSVFASANNSSILGNLLMVGREEAALTVGNGRNFIISGDVLVSAQDYGVVSSSLQSLDAINAVGGIARIDPAGGGTLTIGGNVLVAADAFAGADDINRIAGSAQGGTALIGSTGGTLNITGNSVISARGVGTSLSNIQTGATVRGGIAQLFSTQGGQLTLGGNLDLSTDAIGAQGSLFNPSTVSDAFGGQSQITVFNGAGSISIAGEAFVSASAVGGSANTTGTGSLGDAGSATVNVDGAGTITITGQLQIDADGTGGNNASGVGGTGLGGRASLSTSNGGTITIGQAFDADAVGLGGNGRTGGDGFGGIAGANVFTGAITLSGGGFVTAAGLGGNATFGFGGNGGLGRGGNAFFRANGTLTDTASLTVTGDALAFAQGVGGNGGPGDGSVTPAGRGGDGYGGQSAVPNQADPGIGSGAFILAGGDNGTISVSGEAYALATGFGGQGGNGGSVGIGGRGGDAFGGLVQVGLALLGQNGSLGLGTADFAGLRAEAEAIGGRGGFSIGDFPTGNGGNALGGNVFLTVEAGTVTAGSIDLDAEAFGGEGANGGTATGGIAAAFGSLGGVLTAGAFSARASGFGGFGGADLLSPGNGGNGFGGEAVFDMSGITVQINGDALVQAEGEGGGTGQFTAGNGTGGNARLGVLGTIPGSGTITGNTIVSSNGFGGGVGNANSGQAGDGFGGTSSLRALGGGTVDLATVQVMANGFSGEGEILGYLAGNGTGGNADITASGTGSRITIARNVTTALFDERNFGAIMSATGVGGLASAGTGIGGTGRGGTALISAALGGTVALPATPFADPDTVGFIRLFARGFGGSTTINGGTGGNSFGGNVIMDVNGGALTMGETVLSSFTQAGTAANGALDVTGGNAFAGSRTVRVRNGGTATLNLIGGGAGAQGGNGSGTGNGGNAFIGQNLFEIDNATVTIIGEVAIFDQSQGGDGRQGGSVFNVNPFTGVTGSLNILLNSANITFIPNASGVAGIGGDFVTRGGNGLVRGGNAQGPDFNLTISQTNLSGGRLAINPVIRGGDASDPNGIGGNAQGSRVNIAVSNSQLTLPGETLFASNAVGGTGGASGVGGNAITGDVDAVFTQSTISLVANAQGIPGVLRVRAQADGGQGAIVGNANSRRALLNLVGSTLTGSSVNVESRAIATTAASGRTGGTAQSQEARIGLFGVSAITADLLEINAGAASSQGGSATGGFAALQAETGSTATVTAPQINLIADATTGTDAADGIAGATQGGSVLISALGGNLTVTGNVLGTARGIGETLNGVVSGAVARGGNARLSAAQGGNVTLNGNITLDASATGSNASLTSPSTVSDAFGGNAQMLVFPTGGTLTINGNASLLANARGGSSNNAGAGSLADAGVAIANIDAAGAINISGRLTLDAEATGGQNAGGTGGAAFGGRASATTFNGGVFNIGRFDADTLALGGNGRTGGDAFGGIAGINAIVGEINVATRAFAGSEAVGGSATFGVGGNGGNGRGGNSFFQANGNLTQTARLIIGGDAIAFAQGVGGNGGTGDSVTTGGRGGDGFGGGQGNVPNQADPNFGSGAFLLAGGDRGTLEIGGDAVAVGTAAGGRGGNGGPGTAGGRGGDAFSGLAQAGLALLGADGSVGLGVARFGDLLVQTDAFAGNGGTATDPLQNGVGGNATGGTSVVTVRAGDLIANSIEVLAFGFGGRGGTGGNGTGGFAGVLGSLAGTLSAAELELRSDGFGGESTGAGNGGIGRGGEAFLNYSLIETAVSGDVLISAGGTGGAGVNAAGGDGFGGTARIGVLGTQAGNGTIGGHARIAAEGIGGNTANLFAAGNGTGGTAEALAAAGGQVIFGSLQLSAVGSGGAAQQHEGGDGTGGTARLGATGTGSRIIVQRNVPDAVSNTLGGAAILNASGVGTATRGGNGIGGTAIGGTVELTATTGASIALPTNLASDPNSTGISLLYFARAFAGGSAVEGGIGGNAFGGNATILVDGGTITMGPAALSPFAQGGNSLATANNITGGSVTGGNRTIRVINGGTLTMQSTGGGPGGIAGNGSGSGNGGNVTTGNNLFEVINSTANLIGNFNIFNGSTGGNGNRGGDVTGGTLTFNVSNATINLLADANGNASLALTGTMQGGNGVAFGGGTATGTTTTVNINNSTISGGRFEVNSQAIGGNATGTGFGGGSAIGGSVTVSITGSQLNLVGETLFAADARGGASGPGANGGLAESGTVDVTFTDSVLTIAANANPGILRVRSRADGGQGNSTGTANSSRATLNLSGTTLNADQIFVEARAFSFAPDPTIGIGTAVAGEARLNIAGNTAVTTDLIEISTNAQMAGIFGAAYAGQSTLVIASGSTATVNAGTINLLADASGANPSQLVNYAGRFSIELGGGTVNAGTLLASATGDTTFGIFPGASQIIADGGSLNVASTLTARTIRDLLVRTGDGGIIGGDTTTAITTAIDLDATGTIEISGDGSTGGLGGQTIDMLAGRSILLNGNVSTRNGAINITANHGGVRVQTQPPASAITMAAGTSINAGTGTVTIHLLDGAGDPQRVNGLIRLSSISAGQINVRNFGTSAGSDITVRSDGVLTASGTGRAIDLASLNGEVINLAGDAGLVLTGGGHYGIFAATPTGSQVGSLTSYARRYNVLTATAYDALNPGGNFAAFRISPVLTVTVDDATRFYGSANPQFTASFAGFLAGDGIDGLTGTLDFTTAANLTSGIGTFAINAALGTLLSQQGYTFTFNPGLLTITPRPITVTANSLSRIYGNANPALTFTVGGQGLVNGDQLSGALATSAGQTTGIGNYLITQGTLAASDNYTVTFVGGQLTITPRPITLIADSLSKLLGLPDPELTFRIGDGTLVNGDRISGSLTRDPGDTIGQFAIRQGTLAAGDNYAVTFVEGTLTINPPPAPPELTSPTLIDEPLQTGEDPPVASEEEEERFGMDFPEQPDAPLISEDPLLDDPVTSGGDASLYSGGGAATPGSEGK